MLSTQSSAIIDTQLAGCGMGMVLHGEPGGQPAQVQACGMGFLES